jgi:hypothetical protein
MSNLYQLFQGNLHFLLRPAEELRRLFLDPERTLPQPLAIFREDEEATPWFGFPILWTSSLEALDRALERYILAEEEAQLAILQGTSFDSALYQSAWESYRLAFVRASENVITASFGRQYQNIFWLWHSLSLARVLRDIPRRILRRDLSVGRTSGDRLKYQVFEKTIERLVRITYDLVHQLASETEEAEDQLFPTLLTRMRDNVLILTEDHIGPDLAELNSYFSGCLGIDARAFRQRLQATQEWYQELLKTDPQLPQIPTLLGFDRLDPWRSHLNRPGYVAFLSRRPDYDPERLLRPNEVQVWEQLLLKLKEFEVIHALRRAVVRVERHGDRLMGRPTQFVNRTSPWGEPVPLSPSTRPLDFMAPWVVDPLVSRFGLIYDIAEFTETVAILRKSGNLEQDRSFRHLFRFQRRINRLALQQRAKLEKYLGDGAFYSAREPELLLQLALAIQQSYREAVEKGFPFAKGLRIALNYGQYRLLPIRVGVQGESEKYEFFGHGVVELTRLTSGKSTREIEEIRTLLVTLGYPETTVNRFFAPLLQKNVDLLDRNEEKRGFYAYINENGTLINEGIVATLEFIRELARGPVFRRVFRLVDGPRSYIAGKLSLPAGSALVGIRKLGLAHLKGLDKIPVYEIVDASAWSEATLMELRGGDLVELLEREYRAGLTTFPVS